MRDEWRMCVAGKAFPKPVRSYTAHTPRLSPTIERAARRILRRTKLKWSSRDLGEAMDAAIVLSEAGIAVHGVVATGGAKPTEHLPLVFGAPYARAESR